jgi:chromosome partitioning protein
VQTTTVINAKGGVGKTTIAINLASWFAVSGVNATILDYDPQGSSLHWLKQRPPAAPRINAADAAPHKGPGLASLNRAIPRDTEQLIIDAPAGPNRLLMRELLDRSHAIVIPVAPSKIDIHATANFIRELLLITCTRHRNIRVAVVANRARESTAVYEPLQRFVYSLRMSFLTCLFDSEVYIEAGDSGLGVYELDETYTADQRREFFPIVEWVDPDAHYRMPDLSNVVPFAKTGA